MAINLILRKDVPSLGKLGDVVSVAPGYARNYLLPQGLAVHVSDVNVKRLESERKKAAKEREAMMAELRALAGKLASASCTIASKANEEGHLYGSVDGAAVAEALAREGFKIDPKTVKLEEPLKELGVFNVKVALAEEVEAEVKVWVVEDKGEEKAPE